jgi:Putative stress-responsive transcriptional regulator
MKKLKKSKERMLCGVCGGIAEYLNIDPTIIRAAVLFAWWFSPKWSVSIIYLVLCFLLPEE